MTTIAPTLSTIPIAGAARWAYVGNLAPNGRWYFAPVVSYPGPTLTLDPATGATTLIPGPSSFSVVGTSDGASATLDGGGLIYSAPYELTHDSLLVIDTSDDSTSTLDVGSSGQYPSAGGVFQPDNGTEGSLFFVPGRDASPYGSILKVDCATQATSFIDVSSAESIPAWGKPILVGDILYACEQRFWSFNSAEQRVLAFDTLTETHTIFNAGTGTNTDGYWPVPLPGNKVFFAAGFGNGFIIDTDTNVVVEIAGAAAIPAMRQPTAPNGDIYVANVSTYGIARIDSTTGAVTALDTSGLYPQWSLGYIGPLFFAYDEITKRVVQVDTTDDTVTSTPIPAEIADLFLTYTTLVPDTNTPGRAYVVPDVSDSELAESPLLVIDATVRTPITLTLDGDCTDCDETNPCPPDALFTPGSRVVSERTVRGPQGIDLVLQMIGDSPGSAGGPEGAGFVADGSLYPVQTGEW